MKNNTAKCLLSKGFLFNGDEDLFLSSRSILNHKLGEHNICWPKSAFDCDVLC